MDSTDGALVALVGAAALHLGFQLTVTLVVYPALVRSPDWERAHPAHTRAVTPVVVLVYGVLALAVGWALVATWPDPWVLVGAAGAAASLAATALVAGPTHGRLGSGRDEALLDSLLAADRVRLAGAVVCCLGSVVAVT